jgi:hypothetical protein
MISRLTEIIRSNEFKNELTRFIPFDVLERTLQKEKFIDFLINENMSLLLRVKEIIKS